MSSHLDDIFEDLEKPHPENFKPNIDVRFRTAIDIDARGMQEIHEYENKLRRREFIGDTLSGPVGLIFGFLLAMAGIIYLTL